MHLPRDIRALLLFVALVALVALVAVVSIVSLVSFVSFVSHVAYNYGQRECGRPSRPSYSHQLKQPWPAPDPQVDRKGQPYYTTDQPTKLVETKCWVCPSPGVVRATFAQP